MKFLIPTEPDDTHALLAKFALEAMDHHVRLLFMADHPTRQKNSVFIQPDGYLWKCSDEQESILDNVYDVVWYRRARKPYVPKSLTHPADYAFVIQENRFFHESLIYNMAPDAWWMNAKDSARRANSKLLQLKTASACGMQIPLTLCSNDPADIRYFLLQHEKEGVIYKPLCFNYWYEPDQNQIKMIYTTKLTHSSLPNNHLLALTPGLYQQQIKKKYELRVTCFGDEIVAAKLDSQCHSAGQIDWRAIPERDMQIEPTTIPPLLEKHLRLFMRELGIVFGTFDFIVTPDDQYVFLEVNEQGQFLWIEDYNPEIKMLDRLIQFMLNRSRDFIWDSKACQHTLERYRYDLEPIIKENLRRHVVLNNAKTHQPQY